MTWIQTESGGLFDLLAPKPEQVEVETLAAALAKLCRFTGHTRYFYSVGQHSVLVADMLPPEWRAYGLLHDAHEAYIGDMSSPLKAALRITSPAMSEAWRTLSANIDQAVFAACGLDWPMPPDAAAAVHHADLVALATERRDLTAANRHAWSADLPDPAPRRIVPWAWDKALDHFLDRARRVLPQQAFHGAPAFS